MTERFTKLFSLDENLYTEDSPIIIMAGALQHDNENERVLAQCKFKNISEKVIKYVSVSVQPMDLVRRKLGEPITYQYLDLNTKRDDEFGSKNPIYLTDTSTRCFQVDVKEVIFTDQSIWKPAQHASWETIPEQVDLFPNNQELLKQYRLDINPKGTKEILHYKDIWKCSCGSINKKVDTSCHYCHFSLNKMDNVNIDVLLESMKKRIDKEKLNEKEKQYKEACQLAEKKDIRSQKSAMNLFLDLSDYKDSIKRIKDCETIIGLLEEKKTKLKKTAKIGGGLILVLAIFCVFYSILISPILNYNKGLTAIENKDYTTAINLFKKLGDYKDSQSQLSKAKRGLERQKSEQEKDDNYKEAIKCFKEDEDYSKVVSLLKNYSYYKNSLYYLINSYYELEEYEKVIELKDRYNGKKLDDIFEESQLKLNGQNADQVLNYLKLGKIEQAEKALLSCDDSTKNTYQPVIEKIKNENCLGTYTGDKGDIVVTCTVNEDGSYSYNLTLIAKNTSSTYSTSTIEDQTLTNFADCNEMLICDYGGDTPDFIKGKSSYNIYRGRFEYRCIAKKNGDNLDLVISEKCISVDSGAPYSVGDILEETQQYTRSN